MANIISIMNSKGGVGKTTTTMNLGVALSMAGKRALIIDNDPQGNLTAVLGYTPAEQPRTLANLLLAAIDYPEDLELHLQRAIIHAGNGLDLIPASRRLADAAARPTSPSTTLWEMWAGPARRSWLCCWNQSESSMTTSSSTAG